MSNYIASFEMTIQVSEDEWKRQRYNLSTNGDTSIDEICSWVRSKGVTGTIDFHVYQLETFVTPTTPIK